VADEEEARKINPSRLTFARKRRGYKKTQLAELAHVDLRSITGYESGETEPRRDIFVRIQRALNFPEEFFYSPNIEEPSEDSASFRALTKMSARHRDMALTQGAIAMQFSDFLDIHFELPEVALPDLSQCSPSVAADAVRRIWGIGELSIRNTIHLLESKGVRVFSLAVEAREVDAFSLWKSGKPFIFLNNQKSAEHSRFDAAHELGHLILHKHGAPHGREAEHQADSFASAFLMPQGSVLANPPSQRPTLYELRSMKKIWGVSLSALTYRLHQLNLLTDWYYRSLFIQMAKNGFLSNEPDPCQRESSLILPQLLMSLHKDQGLTRSRIAETMRVPVSEIEELLFGLVMTSVEGGRLGSPKGPRPTLTRFK
jgi:Zn-dependent peptidase ImmA (M78 family)/DNA-binding XRE family transcriptional regulator